MNDKQRATKKRDLLDLVTCINRDLLVAIVVFLKPFKEMTDQLEGDYDTLHMVWPVYLNVKQLLIERIDYFDDESENPSFHIIEEMKAEGRRYFDSNESDFEPTTRHKIATVLNP